MLLDAFLLLQRPMAPSTPISMSERMGSYQILVFAQSTDDKRRARSLDLSTVHDIHDLTDPLLQHCATWV